jgi:hypothetical protein
MKMVSNSVMIRVSPFLVVSLLVAVCVEPLGAESSKGPSEIPAILVQKGKNLSAVRAVMTVNSTYDMGKSRQDFKGFLLYRRPSDFRFQGVAPGGNSLFELVIRATRFELFIPAEGKLIKGGKDCFGKKFPDVVEIEALIPLALLQWKDVRFDKLLSNDANRVIVQFSFQGRSWAATLEKDTLLLLRVVRLTPGGDMDLTADFGDFSSGEYGWLPRHFDVRSPVGDWRTVVRINSLETNPFLVEKNFQLELTFSPKIEECR